MINEKADPFLEHDTNTADIERMQKEIKNLWTAVFCLLESHTTLSRAFNEKK